jgi:hypothetical protein
MRQRSRSVGLSVCLILRQECKGEYFKNKMLSKYFDLTGKAGWQYRDLAIFIIHLILLGCFQHVMNGYRGIFPGGRAAGA